jgi:alkanesulfonate monooxygenase SsuD/methylene tetrahydromethanopterin reductase-like flavin-dependent oxidoreductase (luciferase family)
VEKLSLLRLLVEVCGSSVAVPAGEWRSSTMQFGLFYEAPDDPCYTHAEHYAEMLDLMACGETLGLDVAWMAEIHFGGAFSLVFVPLMVVPVIAQRTRRIRIGTAVTLLPLHHPLSLPEQAATADLLSGGRLEFGPLQMESMTVRHAWQS